ncbi:MAG: hypothetical protein IPP41_11910 [Rhodocyclaceae bacterium]|nr:hypothetical protein [Rhodocyclaceae bacterium]
MNKPFTWWEHIDDSNREVDGLVVVKDYRANGRPPEEAILLGKSPRIRR